MFMVAWEGGAPADRAEWMKVLQEVFGGASGTYRVRFMRGARGWTFEIECTEDTRPESLTVVANSPETIRFTLVQALREKGMPIDADWGDPSQLTRRSDIWDK
jgi:hypothetical protein